MPSDVSRRPAIAGVGQIVQRVDDPAEALEPIALMENAIRKAAEDAGAPNRHARGCGLPAAPTDTTSSMLSNSVAHRTTVV